MEGNEPTDLYRHFAADGELLYVGISLSVLVRTCAHRAMSEWFPMVRRIEIEKFPSRVEAEAAEKQAIISERPKFNRMHNCVADWLDDPVPIANAPGGIAGISENFFRDQQMLRPAMRVFVNHSDSHWRDVGLTDKGIAVLRAMERGATTSMIARHFGVKPGTITTYRMTALRAVSAWANLGDDAHQIPVEAA